VRVLMVSSSVHVWFILEREPVRGSRLFMWQFMQQQQQQQPVLLVGADLLPG
jgi:hypothetical protein